MTAARPHVVVVGDVAVDVLVVPAGPAEPGTDVAARITSTPGGAGANTAAWLAHLAPSVDVTLVARVGDDDAGRAAAAGLRAAGVRTALSVDPTAATCTVVVLLGWAGTDAGERTMLSDRGAAARLAPADLDPGVLAGATHLHLSGYVLADPGSRPAGLAALAAARAAGLTTSVDPQSTGSRATAPAGLAGVDLLLPNAGELAALTGSADPSGARALLDVVGAVVFTDGARGGTWVDRTGTWHCPAGGAPDVTDSTGAGDAFDAGLLAAWLAGAGPAAALRAGCAAGAAAVRHPGGRPPAH